LKDFPDKNCINAGLITNYFIYVLANGTISSQKYLGTASSLSF
jgi:hypothetical protein